MANRLPPIELIEEQLDSYLKNYSQVDIVAHSMGGLLLRQYLLEHPDSPVRRVLFLSTPHFGTGVANLLVEIGDIAYTGNIQANELVPGSDFLWQLNSVEGSELDGIRILNVYAREQKNLLKGDIVVPATHAWLPWAPNSEVNGDHHLGRRISEDWAIKFLRSGELPEPAPKPQERELWVRIQPAAADQSLRFNETSVHRYRSTKLRREKQFSLCCDKRSGLHEMGGTTLVLRDVQPDEVVKLYLRKSIGERQFSPAILRQSDRPVEMLLIDPDQKPESYPDRNSQDAGHDIPGKSGEQEPGAQEPGEQQPAGQEGAGTP